MKIKIRKLSLILAVSLFFAFGVTAYAEEIQPRWDNISRTSCALAFDGTTAQCYASIAANTDVNKITYNATLAEKGLDGNWHNIALWSDRVFYGNELTFLENCRFTEKGKDYRFTLVAVVYVGDYGETVTLQKSATNY